MATALPVQWHELFAANSFSCKRDLRHFVGGINDAGTVVGAYQNNTPGFQHAYKRFSDGTTLDLFFPGALQTFALGINDCGEIVGGHLLKGVQHGLLYANGVWTTIDFVDANHDPNTKLEDISDLGHITGVSFNADFSSLTSFAGTPVPEPGMTGLIFAGALTLILARCRLQVGIIRGKRR
ncbi:MAG: PEP-CTERM sorting domain-containing protein [Acidobacteriia bacterium]|nr:PEP-CTERM sorting domain-containing protein [Terriglobia bacterium]